jgi:hypothetical protein
MNSTPSHLALGPARPLVIVLCAITLAACSGDGEIAATVGTTAPATTTTTPDVVTTTLPPTTAPVPVCTVVVQVGDSLNAVAVRAGVGLNELAAENGIAITDTIHPDDVFDRCVGNGVDDITGASRVAPPPDAVVGQQNQLNELFANYQLIPLGVDGDSGNYTRQAICAARMGLGLPVHNGHLSPGSEEEATIFAATELSAPAGAPTDAPTWILIDKTCQVIFTGELDRVVEVFPTSTGENGYETHNVRAFAFRFDPALDNGGWHDSSSFPSEVDNPVNGNMYKPIYFNNGQALHGAGYIPADPQSKGCARTYPVHQDMIIDWLGLAELTEATWERDEIGATVVVQGRYVDRTPAT